MAEESRSSGSLPNALWPITAVMALVTSLFWQGQVPFFDERAGGQPLVGSNSQAQDIEARLWQDPLAALEQHSTENSGPNPHTPDQVFLGRDPHHPVPDHTLVLTVTLDGGSYAENSESRIRRRYAIIAALANAGYAPEDETHLGYFLIPQGATSKSALNDKIAFEWWKKEKKGHSNPKEGDQSPPETLLLWTSEDDLLNSSNGQPQIASRLAGVFQTVKSACGPSAQCGTLRYRVIGPNTSSGLRELGHAVGGEHIVYLPTGATASDQKIFGSTAKPDNLHRAIVTDDQLIETLVKELNARGVQQAQHHLVILSEADTFYGRAMPEEFAKKWGGKSPVIYYSYLRGLDGKLPSPAGETRRNDEKKKDAAKADPTLIERAEGLGQKDYLRRLAGELEALDAQLAKTQKFYNPHPGIAAIGILGNDVHDKLLILEALRPRFPGKLFFTTDLDAAYGHPAYLDNTRNLLVASAFDLELRDELQNFPPFRDSYQTAFYWAASLALHEPPTAEKSEYFNHALSLMTPRLFEISRTGALALPTATNINHFYDAADPGCTWDDLTKCGGRIFPAAERPHFPWGKLAGGILILGLLLGLVSWRVRQFIRDSFLRQPSEALDSAPPERQKKSGHVGYRVIPAALLVWLVIALAWGWEYNSTVWDAEPASLTLGISAWPSQALRLFVVLFAVGFFYWGQQRLRTARAAIQQEFGLDQAPAEFTPKNCQILLAGSWQNADATKEAPSTVTSVDVPTLWKSYLAYLNYRKPTGQWITTMLPIMLGFYLLLAGGLMIGMAPAHPDLAARIGDFKALLIGPLVLLTFVALGTSPWWAKGEHLRALWHALVFLILALFSVMATRPPNAPLRGDYLITINFFLIMLSVLCTILLTMWVVEHARLCQRMIELLSSEVSSWPQAAKTALKGVPRDCVPTWLDVQFTARITATLQPLIFGPVVCIALLALARSRFLDDWNMPRGLMAVLAVMMLYAFSAEFWLQKAARRARDKALKQLEEAQDHLRGQSGETTQHELAQLDYWAGRIKALRQGAFKPWYEWSLVQSIGGASAAVALLQYLMQFWAA